MDPRLIKSIGIGKAMNDCRINEINKCVDEWINNQMFLEIQSSIAKGNALIYFPFYYLTKETENYALKKLKEVDGIFINPNGPEGQIAIRWG